MNNKGTHCLARGESLSAISCCAQGLKMFRDTMTTLFCTNNSCGDNSSLAGKFSSTMVTLDDCMKLPPSVCDHEETFTPLHKYTAVTIPKLNKLSEQSITALETILPFALIFNQALAHQLEGERIHASDGKEGVGTVYLKKAIKSYLICWNKIHQEEQEVASGSTLFILACLHNMGRVYQQLALTPRANACFERLLSIIILLGYSRQQFATRLNEAFFPSVSHLVFYEVSVTAPAA